MLGDTSGGLLSHILFRAGPGGRSKVDVPGFFQLHLENLWGWIPDSLSGLPNPLPAILMGRQWIRQPKPLPLPLVLPLHTVVKVPSPSPCWTSRPSVHPHSVQSANLVEEHFSNTSRTGPSNIWTSSHHWYLSAMSLHRVICFKEQKQTLRTRRDWQTEDLVEKNSEDMKWFYTRDSSSTEIHYLTQWLLNFCSSWNLSISIRSWLQPNISD